MRGIIRKFVGSESGSFAPLMAFVLIPVLLAAGMAVDYGMGVTTRSDMRNALDAAALSLTTLPKDDGDTDRQATLQTVYAANGGPGIATLQAATFDPDGTLHVSASAQYNMPTNFMKIAHIDDVPISVATGVVKPPALVNATFKIRKASGYWDKTMTLYGTKFGAKETTKLMEITYEYNGKGGDKGYGTTTVITPDSMGRLQNIVQEQVCTSKHYSGGGIPKGSFLDGSSLLTTCKFTVNVGDGAEIDVSQMQDLYLEMDVPQGDPRVMKSNDPKTSNRLYLDVQYDDSGLPTSATEVKKGTTVDIFTVVPCGQLSSQAWEDGGTSEDQMGEINTADFFYDVTGKCDYTQRIAETRFTD